MGLYVLPPALYPSQAHQRGDCLPACRPTLPPKDLYSSRICNDAGSSCRFLDLPQLVLRRLVESRGINGLERRLTNAISRRKRSTARDPTSLADPARHSWWLGWVGLGWVGRQGFLQQTQRTGAKLQTGPKVRSFSEPTPAVTRYHRGSFDLAARTTSGLGPPSAVADSSNQLRYDRGKS
ncbi:hypothetical protein L209DRAFT_217084 [Thermothelomyces heterothallicus CBS 203.75]